MKNTFYHIIPNVAMRSIEEDHLLYHTLDSLPYMHPNVVLVLRCLGIVVQDHIPSPYIQISYTHQCSYRDLRVWSFSSKGRPIGGIPSTHHLLGLMMKKKNFHGYYQWNTCRNWSLGQQVLLPYIEYYNSTMKNNKRSIIPLYKHTICQPYSIWLWLCPLWEERHI